MKLLQGLTGLLVGAIWGISVTWAGGLYLPNGSLPMLLVAALLAAAVAVPLWRRGARTGAICLVVGCLGGPTALIWLLVRAVSQGAPM